MDIRLIAFDLDGTLLRSDKSISPRTVRALQAASQKGVLLVPATGRLYRSVPQALQDSPLMRYMILCNGAQILDRKTETVLAREEMTPELALQTLAALRQMNVIRGVYVEDLGRMTHSDYAEIEALAYSPAGAATMKHTYRPIDDLDAFTAKSTSVQKVIAFFREQADKQPAIAKLTAQFPACAVSTSIINNVEINAKNATKGNALVRLCSILGLFPSQCMVFGDDTNDCSMLREAGLGVAMGNASPEAMACADVVTETNDKDGVAQMIERTLAL